MFYIVFLFIVGSVMGSFYYCVGTRLANNESLIKPASHCNFCNHLLKWYELIPILSFLFLRGKCHSCHQMLSKEYILYEIFTGFLFMVSYIKFGFSYEFFVLLILSSLLVLIFITDFKYMIILDSPLVISSIFICILKYIYFGWNAVFFSLLCGLFSFLLMLLVGKLGNLLYKREALGGGDIKFSFVMGLLLSHGTIMGNTPLFGLLSILAGSRTTLMALVFSTFLALPYAVGSMFLKKDNEVPFGPFLVSSAFIIYFFLEKFQYILAIF